MKKLFYVLILAPLLLAGQGPSFTVTDTNGNTWDSDSLLAEGITIVVNFFSPSMTCWPSSNATEKITETYNEMYHCNEDKLLFLQVAQWGYYWVVEDFLEEFGDINIPYIEGYSFPGSYESTTEECTGIGQCLTYDWYFCDWENCLQWAYECWILRPDGSYVNDLYGMSSTTTNYLTEFLEDEGFTTCNNSVNIEEYQIENPDKNIYDITGRILPSIPSQGTYIQDGKKYHKIK